MYIDVFINGTYSNTITRVGNASATYTVLTQQNVDGLNSVVTVKVRASENITYNANMTYEQTYNVIVSFNGKHKYNDIYNNFSKSNFFG
jgi:hypothetical protein